LFINLIDSNEKIPEEIQNLPVLIKYPSQSNPSNISPLMISLHEMFVNLAVINKMILEHNVTNFAFVYFYFTCPDPSNIICEGKGEDKKYFMVIEKIKGQNVQKLIESSKFEDKYLIKMLLQVFSALHITHEKFGYVHGDLRCENIIQEETDERDYSIEIEGVGSEQFPFQSDKRYVILDHAFGSFVTINEQNQEKEWLSHSPNERLPIVDIFIFLYDLFQLFQQKQTVKLIIQTIFNVSGETIYSFMDKYKGPTNMAYKVFCDNHSRLDNITYLDAYTSIYNL
jgi:serine/threonine protein kinase